MSLQRRPDSEHDEQRFLGWEVWARILLAVVVMAALVASAS